MCVVVGAFTFEGRTGADEETVLPEFRDAWRLLTGTGTSSSSSSKGTSSKGFEKSSSLPLSLSPSKLCVLCRVMSTMGTLIFLGCADLTPEKNSSLLPVGLGEKARSDRAGPDGGEGACMNSPKGVSVGVLLISALSSDRNCMSDQSTCPLALALCSTLVVVFVVFVVVVDVMGMVGGWSWTGWVKNASWVAGGWAASGRGLTELEDWACWGWSGGVVIVFLRRVC